MLKLLKAATLLIATCAVLIVAMRILFPLPEWTEAPAPETRTEPADTRLGQIILPVMEANPGLSGVLPIEQGTDAFAARVLLIRNATATIDAQYYIWQDDLTGLRLLSELQDAAKRGVRVRLLVDDNGTPALDQELAALDALPSAEVRIFNPFTLRDHRILNYAFDFFRLNRRMHNKSLTVDNAATLVGGRNIGDVYFDLGQDHSYFDLDVLAVGPAASEVATDFERYWFSPSAYPISALVERQPGSESLLEDRDAALRDTPQGNAYAEVVRASAFVEQLYEMSLPLEWVPTLLFSDDPAKAQGLVADENLIVRQLMVEIGTPKNTFDMISAYFISGDMATERFVDFADQGVRVRVLTNALEATDVVPVHAGYINFREALVRGGVDVFELASQAGDRRTVNELGLMELSKAALHAKSFAIDRQRAFIGSLNFDPRSRQLNTEMGLLIDSSRIAGRISDWFDSTVSGHAYKVSLDDLGQMTWSLQDEDGTATTFDAEPNTTMPLRLLVSVMSYLPIQWLL